MDDKFNDDMSSTRHQDIFAMVSVNENYEDFDFQKLLKSCPSRMFGPNLVYAWSKFLSCENSKLLFSESEMRVAKVDQCEV